MKLIYAVIFFVAVFAVPAFAQADTNMQILLDKVKADKKANSPVLKMKDKFHPAQIMSSDGDAHSLFWIVITIIAILYLIALVSGGWGLGGAIHVLLVIALVLFILWLLRII